MIKLVITDVDDTIVKEASSSINPEYYDIIREFRKKGILFGVAFGNADNDIPMINQAKYSYAVKNASENLKKASAEVIGDMTEDAVLWKMREILASL